MSEQITKSNIVESIKNDLNISTNDINLLSFKSIYPKYKKYFSKNTKEIVKSYFDDETLFCLKGLLGYCDPSNCESCKLIINYLEKIENRPAILWKKQISLQSDSIDGSDKNNLANYKILPTISYPIPVDTDIKFDEIILDPFNRS